MKGLVLATVLVLAFGATCCFSERIAVVVGYCDGYNGDGVAVLHVNTTTNHTRIVGTVPFSSCGSETDASFVDVLSNTAYLSVNNKIAAIDLVQLDMNVSALPLATSSFVNFAVYDNVVYGILWATKSSSCQGEDSCYHFAVFDMSTGSLNVLAPVASQYDGCANRDNVLDVEGGMFYASCGVDESFLIAIDITTGQTVSSTAVDFTMYAFFNNDGNSINPAAAVPALVALEHNACGGHTSPFTFANVTLDDGSFKALGCSVAPIGWGASFSTDGILATVASLDDSGPSIVLQDTFTSAILYNEFIYPMLGNLSSSSVLFWETSVLSGSPPNF